VGEKTQDLKLKKFWKALLGYQVGDQVKLKWDLYWPNAIKDGASERTLFMKKGSIGIVHDKGRRWTEKRGAYDVLFVRFYGKNRRVKRMALRTIIPVSEVEPL